MKVTSILSLVLLYITIASAAKWEDCGIPLKRRIYYTGVVVSPSEINVAEQLSDHSISINVAASIKDYTVPTNTTVSLQVMKDGELYFNGPVGDLCSILWNANRAKCPLGEGPYSFSYQYKLPPFPSGTYTFIITTYEPVTENQIGCLSVTKTIIGLGLDECSYTSKITASMLGTVRFLEDNTVIQIGPRGPDGIDLGSQYEWGRFESLVASPDLVGYAFQPTNFVWGIRGTLNTSVTQNQFDGTVYVGWRPDVNDYQNAQLVYQGHFSWVMTASTTEGTPAFTFQSGTVLLVPGHFFPSGFPYPLNIGNMGPFQISSNPSQTRFSLTASRSWCRCNCDQGGYGRDNLLQRDNGDDGLSGFEKGTIAICIVGGVILIVAIVFIIKIRRAKPRPVVYDDADLLDPQKPDYGTIAINEAFEAEEQEYN